MLKSIYEASLLDILPDNLLEDKQIQALTKALDIELQSLSKDISQVLLLPRLDELPDNVLDLLAWQWHVDFYEPIGLDSETKRNLIRESIAWHKIKGTPAAVEKLLSNIFEEVKLEEWFNYPEGEGKPYRFRVTGNGLKKEVDANYILRMIEAGKNLRSHLDWLTIDLTRRIYDDGTNTYVIPESDKLKHLIGIIDEITGTKKIGLNDTEDTKKNLRLKFAQIAGKSGKIHLGINENKNLINRIYVENAFVNCGNLLIGVNVEDIPLWLRSIDEPSTIFPQVGIKEFEAKIQKFGLSSPEVVKISLSNLIALKSSALKKYGTSSLENENLKKVIAITQHNAGNNTIKANLIDLPSWFRDLKESSKNTIFLGNSFYRTDINKIGINNNRKTLHYLFACLKVLNRKLQQISFDENDIPEWLKLKKFFITLYMENKIINPKIKHIGINSTEDLFKKIKFGISATQSKKQQYGVNGNDDSNVILKSSNIIVANSNSKLKSDTDILPHWYKDINESSIISSVLTVDIENRRKPLIRSSSNELVSSGITEARAINHNNKIKIDINYDTLPEIFNLDDSGMAVFVKTFTKNISKALIALDGEKKTPSFLFAGQSVSQNQQAKIGAEAEDLPSYLRNIDISKIVPQIGLENKNNKTHKIGLSSSICLNTTLQTGQTTKSTYKRKIGLNSRLRLNFEYARSDINVHCGKTIVNADLSDLEILKPKSNILPHVGLFHVGTMAVR